MIVKSLKRVFMVMAFGLLVGCPASVMKGMFGDDLQEKVVMDFKYGEHPGRAAWYGKKKKLFLAISEKAKIQVKKDMAKNKKIGTQAEAILKTIPKFKNMKPKKTPKGGSANAGVATGHAVVSGSDLSADVDSKTPNFVHAQFSYGSDTIDVYINFFSGKFIPSATLVFQPKKTAKKKGPKSFSVDLDSKSKNIKKAISKESFKDGKYTGEVIAFVLSNSTKVQFLSNSSSKGKIIKENIPLREAVPMELAMISGKGESFFLNKKEISITLKSIEKLVAEKSGKKSEEVLTGSVEKTNPVVTANKPPPARNSDKGNDKKTFLQNALVIAVADAGENKKCLTEKAKLNSGKAVICTFADLQYIGKDTKTLASNYVLLQDIDIPTSLNGAEGWEPIGTKSTPFTGSFDGKKGDTETYTIRNLWVNRPKNDYVGLFGYVKTTGSIKNLTIVVKDGTKDAPSVVGGSNVGALAGQVSSGTIQNVHVTGGGIKGSADSGGLIGENDGKVTKSSATVDVSGTVKAGGLIGSNGGTVSNSHATGAANAGREGKAGGLIGENDGTVTNSYATGDVAYLVSHGYAGGLIGYNSGGGAVSNSYATGTATFPGSSGFGTGLIGYNTSTTPVTNCFHKGGDRYGGTTGILGTIRTGSTKKDDPGLQDSWKGFSFGNNAASPWVWNTAKNNGWPTLYWQQ